MENESRYTSDEQYLLTEWVNYRESTSIGKKTTITCLVMNNGYEVIGVSACVNPEEYDYKLGVYYATKEALKKIADIVAYLEHQNSFS